MRRAVSSMFVAFGLVAALPAGVAAAAGAADPVKGEKVCKIADEKLSGISGIVAYEDGYIVVNAQSDESAKRRIFFLGDDCKLDDSIAYPTQAQDTEDMVLSPDGKTLWIGDIGDNDKKRETIGLWKVDLGADNPKPALYRLRYPGDTKLNAEALLVNGDGTPIVVTKEANVSHLYVPSAELEKGESGVELKLAGEWKMPVTTTSNPLLVPGRLAVTGGAVAPGGSKVVLRTYADAFEWDVANGDVVAAVTGGEPRITGLPDEPFGEAITYGADGTSFVTVSKVPPSSSFKNDPPTLLKYAPTHNAVKAADTSAAAANGEDTRSFWSKLTLQQITLAVGAVGVVGLIMVLAGVAGIVLFRRRNPAPAEPKGLKKKPADGAETPEPVPAGAAAGGVHNGGPAGMNGGGSGAVYGAGAGPSGAVYGGGPAGMNGGGSGAVYGAGRNGRGGEGQSPPQGGRGGVYGGGPAGMNGGGSGAVYGAGPSQGGGQQPGGAPRQGSGVYGGGPAGMNGGGSGAVYGGNPAPAPRAGDQRQEPGGGYPQNPPYENRPR